MSHPLTVELSDAAYAALQLRTHAAAQTPAAIATTTLEKHFGAPAGPHAATEAERRAARERFERHFGEADQGRATGADNEGIDADLARPSAW